VLTALGSVLGAVAVLIGALSAAGVIGGEPEPVSEPTPSSSPERTLDDAVVDGRWSVVLEIRGLEHAELFEGGLWGILQPEVGDRRQETWIMNSACGDVACDVTWESVETPNRFQSLERDGRFYSGFDEGLARCGEDNVPVTRRLELGVFDALSVDDVWSAQDVQGELVVTWSCDGSFVRGILDVRATHIA